MQTKSICILLSCLAIVLFYFAFPTQGVGSLTWLVMPPLMLAVIYDKTIGTFKLSLLTATLGWMIATWWVVPGLYKISGSNPGILLSLFIAFCFYSALPYAIGCFCYKRWNMYSSIRGAVAAAAIFTLIVNYVPSVLPGNIAHGLYLETEQIQLTAIGGVPLLFFVIHIVGFLLVTSFYLWSRNRRKAVFSIVFASTIVLINYLCGKSILEDNRSSSSTITAALIQPNFAITQRDRESWYQYQHVVRDLISTVKLNHQVDLIVLPEIPVPISYQYFAQDKSFFDSVVDNEALFLTSIKPVGAVISEDDGYFNTVEVVQKQEQMQTYAKRVLLPFGEYLPFENELPFLRRLMPDVPNYFPGDSVSTASLKLKGHEVKIAPLICYEAVFTSVVAEAVDEGASVLINSSNDAWLGASAGGKIHLALSVFRAVEYQRPLIRVTNTGITQAFSHRAKPLKDALPINRAGFDIVSIDLAVKKESFYAQQPHFFLYFYAFFILMYFVRLKRS